MELDAETKTWHTKVGASGRILLPRELREELEVQQGDSLVWVKSDQGLILKPLQDVVKDIQDYFQQFGSPDELWSEELITQRREEAARELRDS